MTRPWLWPALAAVGWSLFAASLLSRAPDSPRVAYARASQELKAGQCTAYTKMGARCKNPTKDKSALCWRHRPLVNQNRLTLTQL